MNWTWWTIWAEWTGPAVYRVHNVHLVHQGVYPEISANAALALLAVACALLDRQVERLAQDFENEGGFTERLYRVRTANRRRQGQ